jgi:hypothetical protein
MEIDFFVLFLLSVSVVGILWGKRVSKESRKRVQSPYENPIPTQLGLLPGVRLREMAVRLERELNGEFAQHLKARVMKKHPEWTEQKYEWVLLEWKRYFLMASLLKSVPMYSEDVDEIWHEMLMFTCEYEMFCREVAGDMVHHVPNMNPTPDPNARAVFDIMYSLLFELHSASWELWGPFFRHPISAELGLALQRKSETDIANLLFRTHPFVAEEVRLLASRLKEMVQETQSDRQVFLRKARTNSKFGNLEFVAGAVILYSMMDPEEFAREMELLLGIEAQKRAASSSCGASAGGCSSYDNDNDCGHGNHDGSCENSCSSGSSCGSSCGGGCSS